jgi:dTDP-glucose pyrophosphorylase/predicted transcriptional regulator
MKNWTEILLTPEDSIQKTIEVLHTGGNRIALVVDNDRKLIGTVTDGDIRRALIKHIDMDCAVKKIMNTDPVTGLGSESNGAIMLKMKGKDLLHIPIIDEHNVLIGLETLQNLLIVKKYDNPVFLMAGGFGKRLHPLTLNTPKPLLPIGNRPILETILIRFVEAGFHNFYISIHYKADMIREYFGDGSDWGVTIKYIHENKPLGTAGSLGMLPKDITKLPIIMMNGDLLTKVDFIQLLNFHNEEKCMATMCIREYDFQVPYGVVTIEGASIQSIVEKPVQKFFVNAGIYVLDPSLISKVSGVSYIDMPTLLEDRKNHGDYISAFPIHEYWIDIGRIDEYENAHKEYSSKFLND